jgi:hypothetical protein
MWTTHDLSEWSDELQLDGKLEIKRVEAIFTELGRTFRRLQLARFFLFTPNITSGNTINAWSICVSSYASAEDGRCLPISMLRRLRIRLTNLAEDFIKNEQSGL